jgi:hypothetical protein
MRAISAELVAYMRRDWGVALSTVSHLFILRFFMGGGACRHGASGATQAGTAQFGQQWWLGIGTGRGNPHGFTG